MNNEVKMSSEAEENDTGQTVEKRDLEKTFQEIYNRYHLKVYNYIAKNIGNKEDATDLLQEVFLLFYHKLPNLDTSTTRIESWLLKVARNLSMSYARNRSKQPIPGLAAHEPLSESDSEQKLQRKELHQKLDEFLDTLNEKERSIFILHKMEGVKYKDLMKIFDISHRTLKRLVRAVLMKLKDKDLFDEKDFE